MWSDIKQDGNQQKEVQIGAGHASSSISGEAKVHHKHDGTYTWYTYSPSGAVATRVVNCEEAYAKRKKEILEYLNWLEKVK